MERQRHGLVVEGLVKKAFKFKIPQPATAKWDIPASVVGVPISVKTIKEGGRIDLGSAIRQWEIDCDFRLVLISYKNIGKNKIITSVDNYFIPIKIWRKLLGKVSLKEIKNCHNNLVKDFPIGQHKKARHWWKQVRDEWIKENKIGKIKPCAKIDSKSQRRWQCSISRTDFHEVFGKMSKKLSLNGLVFPKVINEK